MASAPNPVDEAFDRVAALKAIVSAARRLALSRPQHPHNVELGVLRPVSMRDRDEAEAEITASFNSLELLLDHFNILHMAASFEQAAIIRIGNGLGVARSAIEKGRKTADRWPAKLLREAKDYQSLEAISAVLNLSADDKLLFDAIRKVRNELGHGVPIARVPSITAGEAREVLTSALDVLKP